ncbi:DUF1127 domain-containing protein [Sulfitobacter aestuariivivens]|uniref:DUF1127 domain-containing protein n=1 Tax=Sulfitobacter aestuariivivens TaxID=2766981 RepID=A0A927D129_9RHOB|nr:DUF1127 domain-containing protein [Sulfitobacter aestuariivivens]MBD3663135.1 DUF1127 domain-containing protein [Sulfitobacter aestuariivivens]
MAQALTLSTEALGILNQRGLPVLALVAVKVAVCATKWSTRHRTRSALARLEPWQLHDVGLTPAQAKAEAARAFWKS